MKKRVFCFIMVVIVALSLTACGSKGKALGSTSRRKAPLYSVLMIHFHQWDLETMIIIS